MCAIPELVYTPAPASKASLSEHRPADPCMQEFSSDANCGSNLSEVQFIKITNLSVLQQQDTCTSHYRLVCCPIYQQA